MGRAKGDAKRGRTAYRLGLRAEGLAALLLRLKGYRILARRLKTPAGEIDMVVRRGRVLALVEVKARGGSGMAVEALGARQRQRLERAAAHFLGRNPALGDLDLRFDMVLVAPRRLPLHMADAWRP